MERSLFAACFLALVMASTAFAQPAKKAAPAQPALNAGQAAAIKEMELLMSSVKVPFPTADVPDEVKPICVAGRKAFAIRYGAYGSIIWDIDVNGRPVSCNP